ncbi:MAG: serine/threonine protein kinase [Myxococcales bacterium]|nr:serine/threonine protein kinase [Myxococcales bacterium]
MSDAQQPAFARPPYVVGDVIDGKYSVVGLLGEGSYGWVYLAAHTRISSLSFAVKVLKAEHTADPETVARFRREAETVASLKSRHSVRITDYGVAPEGLPYIVMEYVDGLSVAELLSREGPFDDAEVVEISLHVLRAVEEAHRLGVIHRDLKPDNILIVRDPDSGGIVARVLDFGLAKILEPQNFGATADATAAGMVLCTARYAAPDLLRGSPGPQSDIYAWGISMIEMLDGAPPYAGDDFYTVAAQQIADDPVPLGTGARDSRLAPVIRRACAKSPRARYASVPALLDDLEAIAAEVGVVDPVSLRRSASVSLQRRYTAARAVAGARRRGPPWVAIAATSAAIALAIAAGWWAQVSARVDAAPEAVSTAELPATEPSPASSDRRDPNAEQSEAGAAALATLVNRSARDAAARVVGRARELGDEHGMEREARGTDRPSSGGGPLEMAPARPRAQGARGATALDSSPVSRASAEAPIDNRAAAREPGLVEAAPPPPATEPVAVVEGTGQAASQDAASASTSAPNRDTGEETEENIFGNLRTIGGAGSP